MKRLKDKYIHLGKSNILVLSYYGNHKMLRFFPKYGFGLTTYKIKEVNIKQNFCLTTHTFWQLTDEDVEQLILPRII